MRINLSVFVLSLLTSVTAFAAEPVSSIPTERVLAEMQMETTRSGALPDSIYFKVNINAEPGYLILDTGAAVTVLDEATFPNLYAYRQEMTVHDAGGRQREMPFCDPPDLKIGPCSLIESGPVVRMDLEKISALTGRRIVGIFGVSAIRQFVVQLDFDQKLVRFIRSQGVRHPDWGKQFGIEWTKDEFPIPCIDASLSGRKHVYVIDTGSTADIAVPIELFEPLAQQAGGNSATFPHWTAFGMARSRCTRLSNVEFSGARYPDLLVESTSEARGMLGFEFLSRHLATIDFPDNQLYLKPGKGFDHRPEENMSGLHVLRRKRRTIAEIVDRDSPAYDAGMRDGDVVIAIDGRSADEYDLDDLRELLRSKDGRRVSAKYQRGSEEKIAQFTLRRKL